MDTPESEVELDVLVLANGTVVFVDLPPEFVTVAAELNPERGEYLRKRVCHERESPDH